MLCRHLQSRLLPQVASKQSLASTDSAEKRDRLPNRASCLPVETMHPSAAAVQQSVPLTSSDTAGLGPEQGSLSDMSQGGEEACRSGQATDHHGSTPMAIWHSSESAAARYGSAQQRGRVKYFQRKQLPWLTGWWESACAFMAVFLLPLISIVPFTTTAERPDSQFGQP